MYVSRIMVEDIKSFHGPSKVDLILARPDGSPAGWTVIAGRNGSGKTTLLRAMALALGGPKVARSLVPEFEAWVTQGAEEGRVEVSVTQDERYDLAADGPRLVPPFTVGLFWSLGRGRKKPMMGSTLDLSPHDHAGLWADYPEGWFCAAYGPFRRLTGGLGEAHRLSRASGPAARQASLFFEDASLAEGVAWLVEQHLRTLEGREGAAELKRTALEILGDGLLPDGYRITDVDSEGLWVERDGRRFPLREMSDGFRTVAALVVDILKQMHEAFDAVPRQKPFHHMPGVVIIDEIDAHLHVSWQRRIGPWLTSHFPHIQFIVTTHSPYVCQAADPGGLIRLPGVDEEWAPEVVSEDLYDRVVYGSGDDAVLSELFGLDTPYSERAEQARAEFVELEARIYDGEAAPETLTRYRALKERLASSPSARLDEMNAHFHRLAEEIAENGEGDRE